jgi:hypothetical protein
VVVRAVVRAVVVPGVVLVGAARASQCSGPEVRLRLCNEAVMAAMAAEVVLHAIVGRVVVGGPHVDAHAADRIDGGVSGLGGHGVIHALADVRPP